MPSPSSPHPIGTATERPAIPRTVWALGWVSLLMDISSEMVQTMLPLFLVGSMGAPAILIGLLEGVSVVIAMVVRLGAGILSDRWRSRKGLVSFGYGLAALSKLFFPLAESIVGIACGKFLDRIGKGIRSAPRDALLADASPPAIRGACFGLRKSMDSLGGVIGPLIAVLVLFASQDNFRLLFWLAVIPATLAVCVLLLGVREPDRITPDKPGKPPIDWHAARRLGSAFWTLLALAALLGAARFSEAFLLLRAHESGIALTWAPLVILGMHLIYSAVAYPVGRLSDRLGRRAMLPLSLVFLAAANVLLALWPGNLVMLTLALGLWGLHMGFSQGVLATLVADVAPADLRGTAFGLFNLSTGLAVLVGNLLAGLLWDSWGSVATFSAGAIFALLTLAGSFFLKLPSHRLA